ncbi:hypothetical protein RHSIM_Rhsim02G0204000 [Rhododendron simsii]|uniref:NAC domain-containing protein n=1 Tax=Rhododendron simsii TaxID=118357 RepID=A0A834HLE0_RHOSS|nr:hypothetical protein RHSIM_Rhsim02G0204000 [Rhododendron simsii]
MIVPKGYRFSPTDQELLLKYLEKKRMNEALPCGVVIEREIYGAVDKAPCQNRIVRKASCGSWHRETAREVVKNDKDCAIGYKMTLYFEIAAHEPIAMDRPMEKGHWIMQEYSPRDSNTDKSKGKYVLCRIKRFDSKYTKVSTRKRKNVKATTTDNDLIVLKPAKRVIPEVMQEKKMECDIAVAPDTEVVPFSKDQQFGQD